MLDVERLSPTLAAPAAFAARPCPRRLQLAKLFDRGGELFDHFTPSQWINPADKRASR